jgi:hypothetical protein
MLCEAWRFARRLCVGRVPRSGRWSPTAALALAASVATAACTGRGLDPALRERVRRGADRIEFASPVVVPMVGGRLLPVVEVSLNGHGPYRFLVDVGGNVVSLRASVAREVGAAVQQRLSSRSVVRLDSLRIGTALLHDAYAVTEPELDVDGVIGFNVFREGLLTLDYVGQRLAWGPGTLPPADGRTIVPYELRERMPYVRATVGTDTVWFNFDTGARGTLIVPRALEARWPLIGPARAGPTLWNQAEGAVATRSARLRDDLRLGEHVLPSLPVLFSPALDRECLLGSGALQDFVVTFDLARHRVRLVRPGGRP